MEPAVRHLHRTGSSATLISNTGQIRTRSSATLVRTARVHQQRRSDPHTFIGDVGENSTCSSAAPVRTTVRRCRRLRYRPTESGRRLLVVQNDSPWSTTSGGRSDGTFRSVTRGTPVGGSTGRTSGRSYWRKTVGQQKRHHLRLPWLRGG